MVTPQPLDASLLWLHFSAISNEWATASLNCYSNLKKRAYHLRLGDLYAALARLDFAGMEESRREELKKVLDFFMDSLSYLKNSMINNVPYELIHCLRCAMKEWLPDADNYIMVTSYGDYSIRYKLALDTIHECIRDLLGIGFPYRLVQICLPKSHERNYLCNVALYHELGHFVESKLQMRIYIIYQLLLAKDSEDVRYYFPGIESERDIVRIPNRFLNYVMEYFADLFAAQYVGPSLMHYLGYIANEAKNSPTHPSTERRQRLVSAFLHPSGTSSDTLRIIRAVTERVAGLTLANRNRPLPSPDDFYHLLPCEVTEESQLHSLFEVAWAIWLQQGDRFERLNGIPTEHRLTPLQRFNILNNLIEKSINNYIVTEDWRKHHE